jgi:hypothetical protein
MSEEERRLGQALGGSEFSCCIGVEHLRRQSPVNWTRPS